MPACPKCGSSVEALLPIEAGMKLALQAAGESDIPNELCSDCYEQSSGNITQGLKLRLEQKAKQEQRVALWKNRVNFVKEGRKKMIDKKYTEAAVNFEKYIRILEITHDLGQGELAPEIFDKTYRSKEITIIASVYWDLIRIYDTTPNYKDRVQKCANRLALFAPKSSILPDIIKKAQSFAKKSKNSSVINGLLKKIKQKSGPCFIASAAYEDPYAYEVCTLRTFRDLFLKNSPYGRKAVAFYYKKSPHWADQLDQHPHLKPLVRGALKPIVIFMTSYLKIHKS